MPDEGFHHEHGNKGKKRRSKLSGRFGDLVREKLSKGVTNSAVIFADLRKIGYQEN
jgi:hypothetical protein